MSPPVHDQEKIDRLQKALGDVYTINTRIGGGGMGDVYVATHKTLGGKWAIKLLAEDLAKDAVLVERFINEAKIEANLQHPNIVKVFDIGQKEQFHYLVMSFVEGEDLDDRLRQNRTAKTLIEAREAVNIALQIVKALECAHDNSIIHRDLKPSNIRIDRYGTVVVMDFGIARVRQAGLQGKTVLGERLGTPLYMSPEQAAGRPVDVRSDLYSLGVILYEMVAGANPFEAENAIAICMKHIQYNPAPLVEVRPDVHPLLSDIAQKLLEKDPANRYQTAGEVRDDLALLSMGTEVRAARPVVATPLPPHLIKLGPLDAVLHPIPSPDIHKSLSERHAKLLALVDGTRTIREVLKTSGLSEPEAADVIQTLQIQGAIYSEIGLDGDEPDIPAPTIVPGKRTTSRSVSVVATTPVPGKVEGAATGTAVQADTPAPKRRIVFWVVPAAVLLIGLIAGGFFLFKTPVSLSPVSVDASPFARVTITSANGEKVMADDTPFTVSLEPGTYDFAFESAGQSSRKLTKQIGTGPSVVRIDFWTPDDTKKLLEGYDR